MKVQFSMSDKMARIATSELENASLFALLESGLVYGSPLAISGAQWPQRLSDVEEGFYGEHQNNFMSGGFLPGFRGRCELCDRSGRQSRGDDPSSPCNHARRSGCV